MDIKISMTTMKGQLEIVKMINLAKSNEFFYKIVKWTPLTKCSIFSKNSVYYKREDMQDIYSFKIRGALNMILQLDHNFAQIYTSSAGNHGQGVAMACQALGKHANIVMPLGTPEIKVDNVRKLGANVILFGESYDDAQEECQRLIKANKGIFVPPFDHPQVIAGQGTIGYEIWEKMNQVDRVFIPVGGGGLIAGVATYLKFQNPKIKIMGVETYDACGMLTSVEKGEVTPLKEVGLFADGTAVKRVGNQTFHLVTDLVDEIILVNTDQICLAIRDIYRDTRVIVEPSGALALAGLKKFLAENQDVEDERIVLINSGANMDFNKIKFVTDLASIVSSCEAILTVEIPEKPGAFMDLYSTIAPRSVTEFNYQYHDTNKANICLGFHASSPEDLASVILELKKKGFSVQDIKKNELGKSHLRFMGGVIRQTDVSEKLVRFTFPERPKALGKFLNKLKSGWNISKFQYRNYGDDMGRVLVGIQIPASDNKIFLKFLNDLQEMGYAYHLESDNPLYLSCV